MFDFSNLTAWRDEMQWISRGEAQVDGAAARLARLEEDWTFCFLTMASSEKI